MMMMDSSRYDNKAPNTLRGVPLPLADEDFGHMNIHDDFFARRKLELVLNRWTTKATDAFFAASVASSQLQALCNSKSNNNNSNHNESSNKRKIEDDWRTLPCRIRALCQILESRVRWMSVFPCLLR
jgi:hypothetical protein